MNYFAHGRPFLDRPYLVAGTAVPDWLNVVHRRVKARSKSAQRFVAAEDERVAEIARGIVQHHHDDRWFHQTRAFAELNLEFTVALRDLLAPDPGFRPSFLGHILVELVLDATLTADEPEKLDAYYEALAEVDPVLVNRTVSAIATQPTSMLLFLIPRFSRERFLYDYLDNEKLLFRLNNVMRRVGLPHLPSKVTGFLPVARQAVRARKDQLLSPPEGTAV